MKTINLYYDEEFTGLHQDTTLISLAIIDGNGREFYAEFTDYSRLQCDDWIADNVIDNLLYKDITDNKMIHDEEYRLHIVGNKQFIKYNLLEWLKKYDNYDIQFVSDVCHYDFVLLIDLLSKEALELPKNISAVCHDINRDISVFLEISEKEAFDINREKLLEKVRSDDLNEEQSKHNCLWDAKVIKLLYENI